MQRRHPGQPRVQREKEVQALLGAHLPDDDPGRPHPQALLHQVTQSDLTGALEPLLPRLHRDPVGMVEPQLEDLFGGDHPVTTGDARGQAVEQGGLAGLRAARHDDVEAGPHGRVQELRSAFGEAAEADQVVQLRGAYDEFADVHRAEPPGDPVEHHVQAMAVGKHRVDERLGQVDAASAGLEHPLDELLDLRRAEDGGGELVPAGAGHEHSAGVVDPDLLDGRVVEIALQRAEPGHPGDELLDDRVVVIDRGDRPGEAALVVVDDEQLGDPPDPAGVALRVDAVAAHRLAQLYVERVGQLAM